MRLRVSQEQRHGEAGRRAAGLPDLVLWVPGAARSRHGHGSARLGGAGCSPLLPMASPAGLPQGARPACGTLLLIFFLR